MSRAAMLKDLKRSGLTETDAKKLSLKVLTPAENEKLTGFYVPGYLIPYTGINKKKIKNAYRVRHLEDIPGKFGSVRKKPVRYTGPKGQLPHLYFPPNFGNWAGLAKDTGELIYLTEGEKKAAALCKAGLPCISVAGCWGWKSKKHDVRIIKDFKLIDWGDADQPRPVAMIFDNDVIKKSDVLAALNALSVELVSKGAQVFIAHLPDGPYKGADDFLVAKGIDALQALPISPFVGSEALWRFNERCVFIENQAFVYDLKTRRNYNSMQKLGFAFANDIYYVPKANPDDGDKAVQTALEWLKWDIGRRTYDDLIFAPGDGEVVDDCINTWPGWGCNPVKGDVKPFYALVDFVFQDEPALKEHFIKWLAYPLQHPGTKMYQSFLFWSQAQGIGKSFLGLIMARIYGDNFSEVTKDDLTSGFNQWRIDKQFILGDEITGSDSKRDADKVKGLITADTFICNQKNQGTYPQTSCENYLLTSNHENAIYMSGQDRRFVVHHIQGQPEDEKFYRKINAWMRQDKGPAHLFFHLLHEINLTGFNPRQHAPQTEAKTQMLEDSKSALEMQIEDMLANPDQYFQKLGIERDVFTAHEILRLLDVDARQANWCSRLLTKLGVPKRHVSNKEMSKRLIAIRNPNKWRKQPPLDWADNYMRDFKEPKYKKEK